MITLTMLKDSLSLAGKMSQSINQLRRKLIKPTLPPQFSKLAEKSEESSEWLLGDSVSESVENLEKENKLKPLLKDKKDSCKRKYLEESPKFQVLFKVPEKDSRIWAKLPRLSTQDQNHHGRKHSSYQKNLKRTPSGFALRCVNSLHLTQRFYKQSRTCPSM